MAEKKQRKTGFRGENESLSVLSLRCLGDIQGEVLG